MKKPRPLKFTANMDLLNWRGDVETVEYTGEHIFEDFDSEVFMKALNIGDLSSLPSPLPANTFYSDFDREVFPQIPSNLTRSSFKTIESSAVSRVLKFVVVENYRTVNEWRYVNDDGK